MKFIIDHFFVTVKGSKNEIEDLDDLLTLNVKGAYFSHLFKRKLWDGKHHFLFNEFINSKYYIYFRTGLLSYVINQYDYIDIVDERKYDLKINWNHINNIPLRMNKGVSGLEGIKRALKSKIGIWYCATNFGKSRMAIALVKLVSLSNNIPSAIFTHSNLIHGQLVESLKDYCDEKHCGEISSDIFNPKLITICMIPTIASRLKKEGASEYLEFLDSIKLYIADECHRVSGESFRNVLGNCKNSIIRIGMSGTPLAKDKVSNMKVKEMTGSVIYKVKNKILIKEKISAKPTIIIQNVKGKYKYPDYISTKKRYNYAKDNWITNNRKLTSLIVSDSVKEYKNGKDVLIIVNRYVQAENIRIKLEKQRINNLYISGSLKKKDQLEVIKKFKSTSSNKIMISLPVIDEGVDIKNINVLIYGSGGMSSRELLQRIGRAIRKKKKDNTVTIYDYKIKDDIANKNEDRYLFKHYKKRLKIYKKEGFTVKQTR